MTDTTTIALPDAIRAFLADGLRFATIATIDPDGGPRQAVIWYTLDGDDLIINSAVGRRWPANLVRDARISVAVADPGDGYQLGRADRRRRAGHGPADRPGRHRGDGPPLPRR